MWISNNRFFFFICLQQVNFDIVIMELSSENFSFVKLDNTWPLGALLEKGTWLSKVSFFPLHSGSQCPICTHFIILNDAYMSFHNIDKTADLMTFSNNAKKVFKYCV